MISRSAIVTIVVLGLIFAACGQPSNALADVTNRGLSEQEAIQKITKQGNDSAITNGSSTRVAEVKVIHKTTTGNRCVVEAEVTYVQNGQLRKGTLGAHHFTFVKDDSGQWILSNY